jgi:serine/threonine protein kinase
MLLATYEQNEHYHLILPWAEVDLDDFWKLRFPNPSREPKLSAWLKTQFCGIAGAVSYIHRYNTTSETTMLRSAASSISEASVVQSHCQPHRPPGQRTPKRLWGRHGDIKPANILWFPDRNMPIDEISGTLKISDFGTARFSENDNLSAQDRRRIPNSEPYQSPECRLPDGEISTQCDVWALGCVFLEFACWYSGGRELLEGFQHDRAYRYDSSSFFTIKREESTTAELKQPVVEVSQIVHIHQGSQSRD